MNTPVFAFAFVCLVIIVLIVFVRPRMKPRGKLILSKTMGMSVSIENLTKDHTGYNVSYSGTKAKPSALVLFPGREVSSGFCPSRAIKDGNRWKMMRPLWILCVVWMMWIWEFAISSRWCCLPEISMEKWEVCV